MKQADVFQAIQAIDKIEPGADAATHFAFDPKWRNMNHGSFGTFPKEITNVLRYYQDRQEGSPDTFIRYTFPKLQDESRKAVAALVHAPHETCVFVPNATTGVNTVLRNLVYQPGDVIIYVSTIYGACQKTVEYLQASTPVKGYKIDYTDPVDDADLITMFEKAILTIKEQGKNPKVAIFDTIVSQPGVRTPFEALVKLCKKHDVLSCIDGAHSIGQIPLDLPALDPDFLVSNCHKWLHVPRACALFYVPVRNQKLMPSTLPTSHGYVPPPVEGEEPCINPLPAGPNSVWVNNFSYIGTLDSTPYLTVPSALAWRSKFVWRDLTGETAVMEYCKWLAKEGGDIAAKILGTEVMDNKEHTLRDCAFANIRLPIGAPNVKEYNAVARWMEKAMNEEYRTFIVTRFDSGNIYVRLSGQVYLTLDDFEWAAQTLKSLCERVVKGEWKS